MTKHKNVFNYIYINLKIDLSLKLTYTQKLYINEFNYTCVLSTLCQEKEAIVQKENACIDTDSIKICFKIYRKC